MPWPRREQKVEIHRNSVTVWYISAGPKGCVVFNLFLSKQRSSHEYKAIPLDISTHQVIEKPGLELYGPCEFLDYDACYGSRDQEGAKTVWELVQIANHDAPIWAELEERYSNM